MTRTWTADAAPSTDVTHVRDRYRVVWGQRDGAWWADIGHGYEVYREWAHLLTRGPLEDVTEEMAT